MARKKSPRDKIKRLCPKCRDKLSEHPLKESGIKVDACPSCHGLWFDRWELEGHLGGPDIRPSGDATATSRNCPKCRYAMTSFKHGGSDVVIDMCEDCKGIWLDAGELKHLEKCSKPQSGVIGTLMRMLGV